MTSWSDTIPVDRISEQARQAKPGRAALTIIAGTLFGIGWVTARVFGLLFLAASWSFVAVREGWRASHGPSRTSRLTAMTAEIEDLRTQLARLGG